MKVTVKNYRGIERAEIDLSRIALVGGRNGAGKTSICQAVAAALSRQPVPFVKAQKDGKISAVFTKSEAGALVRAGFDKGAVQIDTNDASKVAIMWPDPEVRTDGNPPEASVFATGLISVVDLEDKARVKMLSELLGAEPSVDDIKLAFTEIGYDAGKLGKLLDMLKENGWDILHKQATEHGARLKGQWEAFTNTKYGKDKAGKWLPEGWEEDLAGASEDRLTISLANAKQALEQALQSTAVDEAQIQQLETEAKGYNDAAAEVQKAEAAEVAAQAAYDAVVAKRQPPAITSSSHDPLECPHCKKAVKLEAGKLVKAEKVRKSAAAPGADLLDSGLDKQIADARQALRDATAAVTLAKNKVKNIEAAAATLNELLAKPKTPAGNVDVARESVTVAERRLGAFKAKTGADRTHASVELNQRAVDLLAPDGVRKTKLLRAIEEFNGRVGELCAAAGFKPVTVDEDMQIRYGGRSYPLLSASEQYRVRVILQLASAFGDGSQAVVIDGADILDVTGRNGLFTLLGKIDLPALIGMTANKLELLPDLEKAGMGVTYWVTQNIAQPVSSLARAA